MSDFTRGTRGDVFARVFLARVLFARCGGGVFKLMCTVVYLSAPILRISVVPPNLFHNQRPSCMMKYVVG